MKKLHLFLAFALMMALAGISPAAAQPPEGKGKAEAQGGVKITVHTHSNNDPEFPGLLFDTDRLSYNFTEGEDFAYSSRPCSGRAPFNELGLNFTPDYPGVDDDADGTAPVRHRVEGTITSVRGNTGTIEGTITSVMCENEALHPQRQESENVIVTHFEGRFRRTSDNEVRVTGTWQFSPTESTGTFAGLEGRGSIQGVLTCLAHERDATQPTCEQRGHFTDFVGARGDLTKGPGEIGPGLRGSYRDTTVLTG
jgi:hypothetical protein